jgi:S1-C subfamily serine protease
VGEAFRAYYREQKGAIPPSSLYPWPAPETIGLSLAPDQIAHVESVAAGSVAARAGLQAGDELNSLAGQPLISIADFSWALDRAPEAGTLAVGFKRGESEKSVDLVLPPEWRTKTDISKRVGTWSMRGMATGGLVLEDLPDDERNRRGLGKNQMGLLVKFVGEYGKHAAAKKAGFQKNDLIVDLGEASGRVTEGELLGRLLNKYRPGEQVKATVLRGNQSVALSLPIQ